MNWLPWKVWVLWTSPPLSPPSRHRRPRSHSLPQGPLPWTARVALEEAEGALRGQINSVTILSHVPQFPRSLQLPHG